MRKNAKVPDGMTVAQANSIIQRPVFGDARCIEARDLLLLAERAKELRSDPGIEWPEALPDICLLTKDQLEREIEEAEIAAAYVDGEW